MYDFLYAVRIFHRQVIAAGVDLGNVQAPALIRVGKVGLQFDKLFQIVVIKRVGVAEVMAWIDLLEPSLAGRFDLG